MKSFFKNIGGLIGVSFLPYLVNFFVIPIYSNYLSADDFGLIGLVMAYVMVVGSWSSLQLPAALSRIYFDYEGEERNSFVSTIINGSVLTSLFFIAIYCLFSDYLAESLFKIEDSYNVFSIALVLLFFNLLNVTLERVFINQQRGLEALIRSIFSQTLSVSSGLYFVLCVNLGVLGFLYSQIVYYASMTVLSLYFVRKQYRFTFKASFYTQSIKYSFPLVFHALGGVVFMYSSIFFLENMLPLAVLGTFFIADKFAQVIKALVNSLNNVFMPIFNRASIKNIKKGKELVNTLLPVWLLFMSLIVLHFTFFSKLFIENYITGDYSGVFVPLCLMTSAYIFRGLYCFSSAPLFYKKNTGVIPKITVLTGCFSLFPSNYILISLYGLIGAAVSILLAFIVSFLLAYAFSIKAFQINLSVGKNLLILMTVLSTNLMPLWAVNIDNIFVLSLFSLVLVISTLCGFYYFNVLGLKNNLHRLREFV